MKNKLFYIIRHGETEYNKLGIVQGSGVDMPLNERGILQAQKFYEYYKSIRFNKIYTSALIRTQQSVLPFIEAGYPYKAIPALNEISWGVFEGKPQSPVEREEYWNVVNAWKTGRVQAKIREGESAFELQARQLTFINYLKSQEDECILIAMHGRAMKSFLCTLLDLPLTEMERFEHTNLCLYILEYDGKSFEVIKHCDTSHLQ
ncbi:MAG: histidine phosphatase family protein [Bacteroidetes bacterium B1(2017)]|nr:MAG: histidine phosphatase family protein [Bacteroidetes bacterium B1(2017)]